MSTSRSTPPPPRGPDKMRAENLSAWFGEKRALKGITLPLVERKVLNALRMIASGFVGCTVTPALYQLWLPEPEIVPIWVCVQLSPPFALRHTPRIVAELSGTATCAYRTLESDGATAISMRPSGLPGRGVPAAEPAGHPLPVPPPREIVVQSMGQPAVGTVAR